MNNEHQLAAILTKGKLEEIDLVLDLMQDRDGEEFSENAAVLAREIQFILACSEVSTTPATSVFVHKALTVTDSRGTRKEIMHELVGAGIAA